MRVQHIFEHCMRRFPKRLSPVVLASAGLAGCELQSVVLAEPDDVVVAEIVLRAGTGPQRAFLHRTFGAGSAAVPDADIRVIGPANDTLRFLPAPQPDCVDSEITDIIGSCYITSPLARPVVAGGRYTLHITLPDGEMTGVTQVPGAFSLVAPRTRDCRLEPDRTFELVWTQAEGAWVYLAEAEFMGLRDALRARGIEAPAGRIRLLGVGVSRTDTTLVFPAELGLFDRGDPEIADALEALQAGLPPEVDTEIVLAAADRNYVNWIRGGRFNPSGPVRVPSISGAGTGLFGSVVTHAFAITTGPHPVPACE